MQELKSTRAKFDDENAKLKIPLVESHFETRHMPLFFFTQKY